MKSIDAEILALEQRISMRKVALGHTASAARHRALRTMASPAMLAGAAALGFVAAGALGRRKANARAAAPDRRAQGKAREQGKGFALGTLLMTGATWFIRSQFGGPVGLARFVLAKIRNRKTSKPAVA